MARTAFVLAALPGSTLILNRLDAAGAGVAGSLLERGEHEAGEIETVAQLIGLRRQLHGDGVVIIDGGANIGTHTIAWARLLEEFGRVIAFEPQERIFYALAGNIALNNCFNAEAHRAVLGAKSGTMRIPVLDHRQPANFGGLSFLPSVDQSPGQKVDFSEARTTAVGMVAIDDLGLKRLDILKLDVEGMEPDVLKGAQKTLREKRPIILAETMKCGLAAFDGLLPGYKVVPAGGMMLAVHHLDPCIEKLVFSNGELTGNA